MMFWDTQMHMVIFCITVLELVMLFFQVIYYLQRPKEEQRLRYLILLILVIVYNVFSGGVMPDNRIPIPIVAQNILAYFLGFSVSMYAIYFYYKLFDLKDLKFLATKGLFIFLFLSFLVGFVAPYLATGNLVLSQRITMIVPIVYGIAFVARATWYQVFKIKESKQQGDVMDTLYLAITAHFSMVCWATVPIINLVGDFQLLEHSVTNVGFLFMSVFYIRSSTQQPKGENMRNNTSEAALVERMKEKSFDIEKLNDSQKEIFIRLAEQAYMSVLSKTEGGSHDVPAPPNITRQHYENSFKKYNLSRRELDVLPLLIKGNPYKAIAEELNISEKTVSKHISNIFSKTGVNNKVELINKLLPTTWQQVSNRSPDQ
jgi:DNA-binding CsgD family transcriptional regulator